MKFSCERETIMRRVSILGIILGLLYRKRSGKRFEPFNLSFCEGHQHETGGPPYPPVEDRVFGKGPNPGGMDLV